MAAAILGGLLPFVVHPAANAGTLGGGDDSGDVVDRIAGCYIARTPPPAATSSAAACLKDPDASPAHAQLDITGWSFATDGGHFNASITTAGAWPAEGALASALPGVQQIEARWVFNSSIQNRQVVIGRLCSNKDQNTSTPAGDANIKYNRAQYCANLVEGPYPASDGYRLFLGVTASLVNGAFSYDWEWGWSSELDQAFLYYNGKDSHDRSNPADKGVIGGAGTNKLTLRAPYAIRLDDASDEDPTTPETRTHYFAEPGGTIHGVTALTAGNVMVSAPDPAFCEADPKGYRALNAPGAPVGDTVGGVVAPVLRQNAPAPLNDPNDCWSVGQGVTFTADWAPGNPFAMKLGGYEPRAFPRAPSWAPGAGANTGGTSACTYPAGFTRLSPNGAAQIIDPVWDANYYYQYTDGFTVRAGGNTQAAPALPGPRPPLLISNQGLQQPKSCGNVRLFTGYHFLDASGPTGS